jgi:predicted DNA-binding antitoxin AbrB/MazE fold protein
MEIAMTVQAIYDNGVFRPLDVVELPDQMKVQLTVEPANSGGGHPALMRLLEIARRYPDDPDSPTDLAAQHDHYLYGTPKRP